MAKKSKDESEISITKIDFELKTKIPKIFYTNINDTAVKETKYKCELEPKDEFYAALCDLKPYFAGILELKEKEEDILMTGASFSAKGVVLTAQIDIKNNRLSAPFVVKTPLIEYISKKGCLELDDNAINLLDILKRKANDYLNGETKTEQTKFKL